MKRVFIFLLLIILLFIPNVYAEEYKYYELDISTKEKYMNLPENDNYIFDYLYENNQISINENYINDDEYTTEYLDNNGNLLFKSSYIYDEEIGDYILKDYEISKDAPSFVKILFNDKFKLYLIYESFYGFTNNKFSNFLLNYDGVKLILKEDEKAPDFNSDKECDSVCINNVKILEKTRDDINNSDPIFDGLELNFDVSLKNVDDNIKYEVNINNPTDKDYEVSTPESSNDKDYIKYEYTFKDNDNILKANSNKTMYISVRYNKEVEKDSFVDGVFKDENKAVIKLANEVGETPIEDKKEDEVKIPDTYTGLSVLIIFGLIAILGYLSYNKLNSKILLLIFPILLLPIIVNALETLTINVSVNAKIDIPSYKVYYYINWPVVLTDEELSNYIVDYKDKCSKFSIKDSVYNYCKSAAYVDPNKYYEGDKVNIKNLRFPRNDDVLSDCSKEDDIFVCPENKRIIFFNTSNWYNNRVSIEDSMFTMLNNNVVLKTDAFIS